MNADGSGQRNLTRSPANEGRFAWAPGRSKQGRRDARPSPPPHRGRHRRDRRAGRARRGRACTDRGGEERASPGGRVTREMSPEAKSVIVFVSVGGKEYAATAGTRRPKADQRFRIGSVTKTFTATIVFQLMEEGKLLAQQHAGTAPAGRRSKGREITIRHLLGHRSGLANVTDYPEWLEEAERSPSTSPINSLRFGGLQATGVPARQPGALFEHELPRARSRDREGHGTLVRRSSSSVSSTRSVSRGRSCRRRAASLISTTPAPTRTFPGRRARSSRTRTTSPASTPPSSRGE